MFDYEKRLAELNALAEDPKLWDDPQKASKLMQERTSLGEQEAIIARPDSRPGLTAIRVPAMVLVGEQDVQTPPEVAREIASATPGARRRSWACASGAHIPGMTCRRRKGLAPRLSPPRARAVRRALTGATGRST